MPVFVLKIFKIQKHKGFLYKFLFVWAFICKFAPRLAIVQSKTLKDIRGGEGLREIYHRQVSRQEIGSIVVYGHPTYRTSSCGTRIEER